MNFTYPKQEKLKSRTTIDLLFKDGETVTKYPLRLVYRWDENREHPIEIGVSVSKKYFKKATDRNYFKRCLREAYRLNKQILLQAGMPPFSAMLFYQSKDQLTASEIQEKTQALFEKFVKKHSTAQKATSAEAE